MQYFFGSVLDITLPCFKEFHSSDMTSTMIGLVLIWHEIWHVMNVVCISKKVSGLRGGTVLDFDPARTCDYLTFVGLNPLFLLENL